MLVIPKTTSFELDEKHVQVILQALAEMPYKVAQPVLHELEQHIAKQQPPAP